MKTFYFLLIMVVGLIMLIAFVPELTRADSHSVANTEQLRLSGWINVVWIDNFRRSNLLSRHQFYLVDDQGAQTRLEFDEEVARLLGGPLAINRRRVNVVGERKKLPYDSFSVRSIHLEDDRKIYENKKDLPSLMGSQPFATILCRFADLTDVTPHEPSWFEGLMGSVYPGMDHYWKEVSYGAINLGGSIVSGWYNLPQPRSHYVYDMDGDGEDDFDTQRAFMDCTDVADPDVFFPDFVGVNLMFNGLLNCSCAYNGSYTSSKDGQTKDYIGTFQGRSGPGCWPTWDDCDWPGSYESPGLIAHEMGHGFGLPHSSGPYNQTYDSHWDIMSEASRCCGCCPPLPHHPEYGNLGVHTISFHKDLLGWIPASRKYFATAGTSNSITIEGLGLPESNGIYLMAQIPIRGSELEFYTVESRRFAGYDDALPPLPGEAVIIHKVDTTRSDRLAQVVDIDNNGNPNDDGAMWIPGESFSDLANGITVSIDSETANGHIVTIGNNPEATVTPAPPSPTPDQNLSITSVWTADHNENVKDTFAAGDDIAYHNSVHNTASTVVIASYIWSVSGPCGSIFSLSEEVEVVPGTLHQAYGTGIPPEACAGPYTYTLNVTSEGVTSSKSKAFTVTGPISATPSPPYNELHLPIVMRAPD